MTSMVISRFCFSAAAAILVFGAGLPRAEAQTHGSAVGSFATIDTDHDARLNRSELRAAASRDFDRLDADGDGYLTRAELHQTHDRRLLLPLPNRLDASAFARADTDRDGKIDRAEYEATIVAAYLRCDRNRDGTIEISDLRHCR